MMTTGSSSEGEVVIQVDMEVENGDIADMVVENDDSADVITINSASYIHRVLNKIN